MTQPSLTTDQRRFKVLLNAPASFKKMTEITGPVVQEQPAGKADNNMLVQVDKLAKQEVSQIREEESDEGTSYYAPRQLQYKRRKPTNAPITKEIIERAPGKKQMTITKFDDSELERVQSKSFVTELSQLSSLAQGKQRPRGKEIPYQETIQVFAFDMQCQRMRDARKK
jgi:hypothetical protein